MSAAGRRDGHPLEKTMSKADTFSFRSRRRKPGRRLAKIIAAPFFYMYESGQFLSMLKARSVDRSGQPLPMFTYPANDFLASIDAQLKGTEVLEFGCGQSTRWFAPRVKRLVGVERNAAFRAALAADFAKYDHVTIVGNEMPFNVSGTFDIIVLDGQPRLEAGRFAPTVLKDDGIIIFDNSDVQSLAPIPQDLNGRGFARVDFFGFSPTGVRKQCTSIFFKDTKWFCLQEKVMPISKNSISEDL